MKADSFQIRAPLGPSKRVPGVRLKFPPVSLRSDHDPVDRCIGYAKLDGTADDPAPPPIAAAILHSMSSQSQLSTNDSWDTVRKRADLDGSRLYDLRHTFASLALGARRKPAGDRKIAGTQSDSDDGAVCASGTGFGQGLGGPGRRQHHRGLSAGRHVPVGFLRRQASSCKRPEVNADRHRRGCQA